MPFLFACPHCGRQTMVDERFAGSSGPCANCGRTVSIPSPAGAAPAQPAARPPTGPPPLSRSATGSSKKVWIIVSACLAALAVGGAALYFFVLAPAQEKRETRRNKKESTNNLRQIAIAIHNHHDHSNTIPVRASFDENGRPLLSWRVHVLPFWEGQNLYQKFRLDEPWDSPHNKALIREMPEVYRNPGLDLEAGETCYLAVDHEQTAFPPLREGRRETWRKGFGVVTFGAVTDGLSNTAFIVEADPSQAVPWTKPQDLEFDPANPRRGLFGARKGGFLTALGDGSVQFVRDDVSDDTLTFLFFRNDGRVFDLR